MLYQEVVVVLLAQSNFLADVNVAIKSTFHFSYFVALLRYCSKPVLAPCNVARVQPSCFVIAPTLISLRAVSPALAQAPLFTGTPKRQV
jgi:hypothetical protein